MLLRNLAILMTVGTVGCTQSSFDAGTPKGAAGNIPSQKTSWLEISAPNWADGITAAEVSVYLVNDDGLPVVGQAVGIEVSGQGTVIVPCTASNERGLSRCSIYSTKAEVKEVRINGGIILSSTVDFQAIRPFMSTLAVVCAASIEKAPTGHKFVTTAGVPETPTQLKNSFGLVRAHTSILGSVLEQ